MCGPFRALYVEYWRLLLGGSLPSPFQESRSLFPCASISMSHWDRFATSPVPTYVRLEVCSCPCQDWIQSCGEGNLAGSGGERGQRKDELLETLLGWKKSQGKSDTSIERGGSLGHGGTKHEDWDSPLEGGIEMTTSATATECSLSTSQHTAMNVVSASALSMGSTASMGGLLMSDITMSPTNGNT